MIGAVSILLIFHTSVSGKMNIDGLSGDRFRSVAAIFLYWRYLTNRLLY